MSQVVPIQLKPSDGEPPQQSEVFQGDPRVEVVRDRPSISSRGRRFKSCPRYKESPGQPQADLDFFFGAIMRSHRLPITLFAHLLDMSTTTLGLEPLIGVEELAEYVGVPVQTMEQRHEDGPHE